MQTTDSVESIHQLSEHSVFIRCDCSGIFYNLKALVAMEKWLIEKEMIGKLINN